MLAWELFTTLSRLFDAYSPLKPGFNYVHEEPWEFGGFLVPIGVAYAFYRTAKHWLTRRDKERAVKKSLAPAGIPGGGVERDKMD